MLRKAMKTFGLILVFAAGWQIWTILDKPIDTLVIEGDMTPAERGRIQQALSELDVNGILSTDLAEFEHSLQSMGWARGVDIRRKWPNKLIVNIRKESPVAKWGLDAYLAADGSLLTLPDQYPNLPTLRSSVSNPQQSMEVYRLLQQFASRQGLRIMELSESAEGEWVVEFANGLALHLGGSEINARMNRFLRAYENVLREKAEIIDYVDARYPSGIAVKFIQEQESPVADLRGASSVQFAFNINRSSLSGI
ncbi:MAG: cell division protein FtsQ [Candidatus Azotimanducaceae bacterium]|jgi:cell division protein FtsQ|tara:strand:- start:1801 stop:2556 length:756 start_codon:yes stop_codon:yes gene_type:complete